MANVIILSAILLSVVGINYGCMKLAVLNPNIISGFELSEEPEQREYDKAWLRLLHKYMRAANIVTLIGGIVGIISGLQIIYYLFLVLPISFAALLAYSRRKLIVKKKGSKLAMVITMLLVIGITCLPILYSSQNDLKVILLDDRMEISGLYGLDIPLCKISEAKLCQSLPKISIKTNGFALGETCLGHFRTTDGKDVILFTHSDNFFIQLTQSDGNTYYLSYKDAKATKQLFNRIQKQIEITK